MSHVRRLWTRAQIGSVAGWITLVVAIGWLDILSGPDYGFGFFYLIAVLPAAWLHGRTVGLVIAVAASLTWFFADATVRAHVPISAVAWNALSRAFLFVAGAVMTSTLRQDRSALLVLSGHDPLTGLYNRHFYKEHVGILHSTALRHGRAYALVAIDVDDLKQLNDRHGHGAGDSALAAFARDLRSVVRQGDVAARIGGDEFLVLMPDASADDAAILADRIVAVVGQAAKLDGDHVASVSIGVAAWTPGVTAEQVLEQADRLLYTSKRSGGGRVSVRGGTELPDARST